MKISKSFKIYIHIILLFLISTNLKALEDFSKNVVIHENPQEIKELIIKDSNLQDVDLKKNKGNIVILNFWATWCAPCKREMPSLSKLSEKYPEIQVYTINMEKPNNSKVDDFFKSIEVSNLKTYYDPEFKLVKQLRMRGVPTSILINKEGNEFGRVVGEVDFMSEYFLNIIQKYI
jgi:thiol-disulfide isomerase/thioredoxin